MISIANVLWRTVLVGTLLKSCRVSPCVHSRRSSRRITIEPAHAMVILPLIQRLPPMHSNTSRLFALPTIHSVRERSSSCIESDHAWCDKNGHCFRQQPRKGSGFMLDWPNFIWCGKFYARPGRGTCSRLL